MPSPIVPIIARGVSTTLPSDPEAQEPRPDGYPSLWRLSPGPVLIWQAEPDGSSGPSGPLPGWDISTDINYPPDSGYTVPPGDGVNPYVTNNVFPPLYAPAGDYEWRAREAATGMPGSVRFTLAPVDSDHVLPCARDVVSVILPVAGEGGGLGLASPNLWELYREGVLVDYRPDSGGLSGGVNGLWDILAGTPGPMGEFGYTVNYFGPGSAPEGEYLLLHKDGTLPVGTGTPFRVECFCAVIEWRRFLAVADDIDYGPWAATGALTDGAAGDQTTFEAASADYRDLFDDTLTLEARVVLSRAVTITGWEWSWWTTSEMASTLRLYASEDATGLPLATIDFGGVGQPTRAWFRSQGVGSVEGVRSATIHVQSASGAHDQADAVLVARLADVRLYSDSLLVSEPCEEPEPPPPVTLKQGRTDDFAPHGSDAPELLTPGAVSWEVRKDGAVIATTAAPAGWRVAWDGLRLHVHAPPDAVVGPGYEARLHTG